MVKALVVNHDLGWLAPGPMWGAFGNLADDDNRRRFGQPAILRFANDAFMEELMGALAFHPEKVAEWKARWESWEEPMTNPPTAAHQPLSEPVSRRAVQLVRGPILSGRMRPAPASLASTTARPLKLYQPVQNRFYLVSASLVCQQPGLPDRHVNPGKQEQVGFVLRRLVEPTVGLKHDPKDPLTWNEYAYVQTAHGPRWQKAADGNARAATLQQGEERLPMFSLGYTDSGNNNRRIFSGLIPVGRREAYVGAPVEKPVSAPVIPGAPPPEEDPGPDTRELLFALQVMGPWHELIEHADLYKAKYDGWPLTEIPESRKGDILSARQRVQTISWYVILDFVRFLHTHAPRVLDAIVSPAARSALNNEGEEALLIAYLETIALQPFYKTKLRNDLSDTAYRAATIVDNLKLAMAEISRDAALQEKLERAESTFEYASSPDWPSFLFPLADPDPAHGPFPFSGVTMNIEDFFKTLNSRVVAALPNRSQSPQPDINIPKEMPLAGADAWFTIRCVYECPNCGPLKPSLLSAPTEVFEMASFFDPEAPARQIRIPMPFNISPAALRRYNKSATLVVSDMLCGQIKRIRKLTLGDLVLSVLPWPFHKDLPSVGPSGPCSDGTTFGMLCSLSIPIVTLCALILLLIIVALFDLFFRWIPLLFVCFPIPRLGPKR